MSLTRFRNLIYAKTGIVIPENRLNNLKAAIIERMRELAVYSEDDYFNRLTLNSQELHDFISIITNNETYFFRNPLYFTLFIEDLIPEIMYLRRNKIDTPIRILSAGCSIGAEPYSIAISLLEKFGEKASELFHVIGADIDKNALTKAKLGVYGKNSFRYQLEDLKQRYFNEQVRGYYAIDSHVKQMVSFIHHNLFSFPYPPELNNVDFIFYRNVSIYFSPESQEKVFNSLSSQLNQNGYIITGPAETYSHFHKDLTLVERGGVFVFHKRQQPVIPYELKEKPDKQLVKVITPLPVHNEKDELQKKEKPLLKVEVPERDEQHAIQPIQNENGILTEAHHYYLQKRYQIALEKLSDINETSPVYPEAQLLEIEILIQRSDFCLADEQYCKLVKDEPFSFKAHYLGGLIARNEQRLEEAVERFRRSLYSEPRLWQAHYFLAETYMALNDSQHAQKEYRVVLKLVQESGIEEIMDLAFSITPEQIQNLCQLNLRKLDCK